MAALNTALNLALDGLSPEESVELKTTFGKVMGEVVLELINPAIKAFPELAVDDKAWRDIAVAQAGARFKQNENS
ncbi:hypothetical protein GM658_28485 [Pseudoduganella eburnea]|uniref:Uncharacterized protein n=1 Tax=Massilia eburnea TaxID=1776165 RepID=A0A6L6QQ43_9BURK|nr:hypothetical protein [Massilia eburnea]MTW14558.1 hypothetical protein [Massilia eburnea]